MRIAFSGTHRTGKSTLLARVAELLPGHETVDEPYRLLEEEGAELAEEPSLEDFEAQLERSLTALEEADGADVLFDRCPFDILAYLLTHAEADAFDLDQVREPVHRAMATLDVVVFVPIEPHDRIPLASHESKALRRAVHDKLEELYDDYEGEVLRVEGDVEARARAVLMRART
jgi:hypothetical protein